MRNKLHPLATAILLSAAAPSLAHAQLVTTMVNGDGASLPCVTVGPLAPISQEYCVRRTEAQGAVKKSELGASGLSIGLDGASDGVVTAVAPGSPASVAGLAPGDTLVSVDGRPVQRPPSDVADELMFGVAGAPVRLTIRRGAQSLDISIVRVAASEPPNTPHSPNILIGVHPMVNWRGTFIPCMGAGLLGPAVIAGCQAHFSHDGFVKVSALGATSLAFDASRGDAAVVASVEPGSAAALAGVTARDVVTQVDGHALVASRGKQAQWLLFGKRGETRKMVVERNGKPITASLVLAQSK